MREKRSATVWSSFPYLKSANELETYLSVRLKGHSGYYHYTSLKAINGILGNGFCISSVDRFNDEEDKKVFKGEEKKYYSLCFSTGVQENLALWYLYSGVDGCGGRIQLTYRGVEKLLHSSFELVEYDYKNHKVVNKVADLQPDINATFRLEDVLYAGESKKEGFIDIKYNTMTNRKRITKAQWKKFTTEHKGFQKHQIWYYEKETRLLIKLAEELYDTLDPGKEYAVILEIPQDVLRYLRVRVAPRIESLNDKEINQYEHIIKLRKRLQLSEHYGKVKINLCRNCDKK